VAMESKLPGPCNVHIDVSVRVTVVAVSQPEPNQRSEPDVPASVVAILCGHVWQVQPGASALNNNSLIVETDPT